MTIILKHLKTLADPKKAKLLAGFFKTGKGDYGEGDIFLGVVVPKERKLAKELSTLSLEEVQQSLNSRVHEERMVSLFILIDKYKKSDEAQKRRIFNFYLKNTRNINNWDLVDLSAPNIVGDFLKDKDKQLLYNLVKSSSLWERRIAVLATFMFIKYNQFEDSLKIAGLLLRDKHDLIHKAVGWMLREIGKRDLEAEKAFLQKHYKSMPRTMLRYAIEKFPEKDRKAYLNGEK